MKTAIALTVASAALLAATSPSYAAEKVIKKFDEATFETVLAAVGATDIEKGKDSTGNPAVLFVANGLKYTAYLRACKPETGCLGLALQCSFDGETFTTNAANSFNVAHIFAASVVSDDRKSIHLVRYLIADGGTTVENVRENLKVFFTMPAELVAHMKKVGGAPVASAAPQTSPVASGSSTPAIAAGVAPGVPAEADTGAPSAIEQPFGARSLNTFTP